MKAFVASDLHLSFHLDPEAALELLPIHDITILAGDIWPIHRIESSVNILSKKHNHIIYVAGNHEFYRSNFKTVYSMLNEQSKKHTNFHFLNNSSVTIDKRRFVGTTMWFPYSSYIGTEHFMCDFGAIENFGSVIGDINKTAVSYLTETVNKDDIVITHHLPSPRSTAKKFINSKLNDYFVCDVSYLIEEFKPKMWIHGHTHSSCDYELGSTRILCNPYGYFGREVNPDWNINLTVDL